MQHQCSTSTEPHLSYPHPLWRKVDKKPRIFKVFSTRCEKKLWYLWITCIFIRSFSHSFPQLSSTFTHTFHISESYAHTFPHLHTLHTIHILSIPECVRFFPMLLQHILIAPQEGLHLLIVRSKDSIRSSLLHDHAIRHKDHPI